MFGWFSSAKLSYQRAQGCYFSRSWSTQRSPWTMTAPRIMIRRVGFPEMLTGFSGMAKISSLFDQKSREAWGSEVFHSRPETNFLFERLNHPVFFWKNSLHVLVKFLPRSAHPPAGKPLDLQMSFRIHDPKMEFLAQLLLYPEALK